MLTRVVPMVKRKIMSHSSSSYRRVQKKEKKKNYSLPRQLCLRLGTYLLEDSIVFLVTYTKLHNRIPLLFREVVAIHSLYDFIHATLCTSSDPSYSFRSSLNNTHGTNIDKWLDEFRPHSRNVLLPNLRLIPRHPQPHADLHVSELTLKLVLLGILA